MTTQIKKPKLNKLPEEILQFNISKKEIIEELVKAGACSGGLHWIQIRKRTLGEVLEQHPDWVLWAVSHCIIPEELYDYVSDIVARAALVFPDMALGLAAEYLPPEILDWCAQQYPRVALEYAAELLTPERLDWCARHRPWRALEHAANLLTKERLDWCAEQVPAAALVRAAGRLSSERLEECARQAPGTALEYARDYLSPELIKELEEEAD